MNIVFTGSLIPKVVKKTRKINCEHCFYRLSYSQSCKETRKINCEHCFYRLSYSQSCKENEKDKLCADEEHEGQLQHVGGKDGGGRTAESFIRETGIHTTGEKKQLMIYNVFNTYNKSAAGDFENI